MEFTKISDSKITKYYGFFITSNYDHRIIIVQG